MTCISTTTRSIVDFKMLFKVHFSEHLMRELRKKRFSLAQTDSTKKGAIVSSLGMTVFGEVHE
jgi:hypothetical protein